MLLNDSLDGAERTQYRKLDQHMVLLVRIIVNEADRLKAKMGVGEKLLGDEFCGVASTDNRAGRLRSSRLRRRSLIRIVRASRRGKAIAAVVRNASMNKTEKGTRLGVICAAGKNQRPIAAAITAAAPPAKRICFSSPMLAWRQRRRYIPKL